MAGNTTVGMGAAVSALKGLSDSLENLRKIVRAREGAPASPKPTAHTPKPAGPPVRTPSTAIPSPAKPLIAPRPMVNPNAPMGAARSIEDAASVVVRHTLQAAAMTLSRVLGRPENDILKALAREVQAESAAGRDFATALNRAKATVAASVRSGVA